MGSRTPYFNIDVNRLLSNLSLLNSEFRSIWGNFIVGYSFKTNTLPWILKWMLDHGAYAEVVSSFEYNLALNIGYSPDKIIFNGPCKGDDTLIESLKNGSIVNLDNFREISVIINNIDKFEGKKIKVGLRINFDLEAHCPNETILGNEPGRFGFNVENEDIFRAIDLLKTIPELKIVGFHGHHSTRSKSLKIFKAIATQICKIKDCADSLEYIDMGGCFFGDKLGVPSFTEYAKTITSVFRQYDVPESVYLIMEPGAALIASPVSYVCKVVDVKRVRDVTIVTTDGSITHINSQMSNVKFRVSHNSTFKEIIPRQIISGFTCIEKDRFAELIEDNKLCIGDEIVVYNVGAYTMSLAPLFIELFPCVIVTEDNTQTIARDAWSIDCFLQKSTI